MTVDLQRYQQIKKKVDGLQKEAHQAEGALAQTMSRLKEEFSCKSVEEAQKLKAKLEKEVEVAENRFDKALSEFEREWGETLGEIDGE